jgi:hypothetical protein
VCTTLLTPPAPTLLDSQVLAFLEERAEACVGEEPHGDAAALHTLWALLAAQVRHPAAKQGAHGEGQPQEAAPPAAAALAAALLEGQPGGGGGGGAGAAPAMRALPPVDPGAAGRVQALLLAGKRGEALEAAVAAQLWPVALLVAKLLGPAAAARTAAAFVAAAFPAGAPLGALCAVLGGAQDGAAPQQGDSAAAAAAAATWRGQAAILAANRAPGDRAALEALGRALLGAGRVAPAHACFLVAGSALQAPSVGTGLDFALVGSSPVVAAGRRTYAALPALLRTQVLAWARAAAGERRHPNLNPQRRAADTAACARIRLESDSPPRCAALRPLPSRAQATPPPHRPSTCCPTTSCTPPPWRTPACSAPPPSTAPPSRPPCWRWAPSRRPRCWCAAPPPTTWPTAWRATRRRTAWRCWRTASAPARW